MECLQVCCFKTIFVSTCWNPTIFNIIPWVPGLFGQKMYWHKGLMFQVSFLFIISCKILFKNRSNYFFLFFYNFTKIKIILSVLSLKITWSMSRSSQQPSILYWRLLDVWSANIQRQLVIPMGTRQPIFCSLKQVSCFSPPALKKSWLKSIGRSITS